MAASVSKIGSSPESSLRIDYPGWSKDEITDRKIRNLLVSKIKEIAASYEMRSLNKDLKSGGPWYPIQYAAALKELRQKKRLDFLVSKNAFYHGFPPEAFTHLSNVEKLGGKEICAYQIKPECQPVQGLDNILNGRASLIDCAGAVQLAMYATLHEILGDKKFNQMFSGEGNFPLCLHPDIQKTPLFRLGLVEERESYETPKQGDCVYFSNIPEYVPRNPNGDVRGYYATCISPDQEGKERKYVAFGAPSEGRTKDEMYDILIQEFNKDPVDLFSILSEDLAKKLADQATAFRTHLLAQLNLDVLSLQLDREGFQRVIEGTKRGNSMSFKAGLTPLVRNFNVEAIKTLI